MKRTFKLMAVFICVVSMLSFTGCKSNKQLNERLIIQGVGIDYTDNQYNVTLMCMDTVQGDEQAPAHTILSATGDTVLDGVTNAISKKGQEPLYSHNLFILLGDAIAKNDAITPLNFFVEYYETRPTVYVFVGDTSANAILTAKTATPQGIANLAQTQYTSGRTITAQLYKFIEDSMSKTQSPVTTQLTAKNDEVQVSGTVVFKDKRLAVTLDNEESLGVLLATGKGDLSTAVVELEGQSQSFTLSNVKSSIEVSSTDDQLIYTVNVTGKADLYEGRIGGGAGKGEVDNKIRWLIQKAVTRTVNQYKTDVLSMGKLLRQKNYEFYNNITDWDKLLKNSRANVVVDISVE